jgi:hypothetical protein
MTTQTDHFAPHLALKYSDKEASLALKALPKDAG